MADVDEADAQNCECQDMSRHQSDVGKLDHSALDVLIATMVF